MYQRFDSDLMADLWDDWDASDADIPPGPPTQRQMIVRPRIGFSNSPTPETIASPASLPAQGTPRRRIGFSNNPTPEMISDSARRERPIGFSPPTNPRQRNVEIWNNWIRSLQRENAARRPANRFDDFDDFYDDYFDQFDFLEDDDFDAASPGVRQQRLRAEQQRRRRLAQQQRRNHRQQPQGRSQNPQRQPIPLAARPTPTPASASPSEQPADNRSAAEVFQNATAIVRGIGERERQDLRNSSREAIQAVRRATQGIDQIFNEARQQNNQFDDWGDADAIDVALPAISRLTVRHIIPAASRLPPIVRQSLTRSVASATRMLARQRGAQAIRAIPQIVARVQRNAQRHRLPIQALPQAIRRTTARVATSPNLVRRLSQVSTNRTLI